MMLKKLKNRRLSRQEQPVGEIPAEEEEADLALDDGNISAHKTKLSGQGTTLPVGKHGFIDPVKFEARKNVAIGYANQVGNFFRRAIGQPEKLPPTGISEANRKSPPLDR